MKFFDNLINDFYQLCDGHSFASRKYCADDICPCDDHLQVIMQRDTAFELEGMGFEFVTSSTVSDSVVVLGDDLQKINANTKFARVCIIGINDTADEQSVHNVIKKIEYEKSGNDSMALKTQSEITKKTDFLTEYTNAKNVELESMQKSLQSSDSFYKKLYETLAKIAEGGGYSMILSLQQANAILWYSNSVDVTEQVIAELGL